MAVVKRLGNEHAWCIFSDDERYRYELGRVWAPSLGLVVFCMLNPSTADHLDNDVTITKCTGFTRRWNHGGFLVVNAFALKSTDPLELVRQYDERGNVVGIDPIGAENNRFITDAIARSAFKMVVAAWGDAPRHHVIDARIRKVEDLYAPWSCLGVTKRGNPKHPSRLSYGAPPRLLAAVRRLGG